MLLTPADETEWNKLQRLYTLIDKVNIRPYPFLTPHITLAYFNRNGFDSSSADKLRNAVRMLNYEEMDITLKTKKLYYQKFLSMNDYINIFSLSSK